MPRDRSSNPLAGWGAAGHEPWRAYSNAGVETPVEARKPRPKVRDTIGPPRPKIQNGIQAESGFLRLNDDMRATLQWCHDNITFFDSAWERQFVGSLLDFVKKTGGLTTKQWQKLQSVAGRAGG